MHEDVALHVFVIGEDYTSQKCPRCFSQLRSGRDHGKESWAVKICDNCSRMTLSGPKLGLILDRDSAAAENIWILFSYMMRFGYRHPQFKRPVRLGGLGAAFRIRGKGVSKVYV